MFDRFYQLVCIQLQIRSYYMPYQNKNEEMHCLYDFEIICKIFWSTSVWWSHLEAFVTVWENHFDPVKNFPSKISSSARKSIWSTYKAIFSSTLDVDQSDFYHMIRFSMNLLEWIKVILELVRSMAVTWLDSSYRSGSKYLLSSYPDNFREVACPLSKSRVSKSILNRHKEHVVV